MQGVSANSQGDRESALHSSTLGIKYLAAADLPLWAQAKPGSKGGRIPKTSQVRANFTQDRLCGDRTDARHIREIDAEDPIEFTTNVDAWSSLFVLVSWNRMRGASPNLRRSFQSRDQLL